MQANIFYEKHKNIDLNFTYKYYNDSDVKYTPLMCAAKTISDNNEDKIKWLLDTGKVNINCTDVFGITPLMTCALTATPEIIMLLCNYPIIQINQQNMHGDTAIMILCKFCNTTRFNPDNMEILLAAGADPEITDNKGISPLERARRNGCEKAIDLLLDAIRKKYEKK
jgi:ankyrin repeat protein